MRELILIVSVRRCLLLAGLALAMGCATHEKKAVATAAPANREEAAAQWRENLRENDERLFENMRREREAREVKKELAARDRREKYVAGHPELREDMREAIRVGKLKIGMEPSAVRTVWGEPDHVTRYVSASHSMELWSYGAAYHLNFVNGKLTSWTSSR